MNDDRLTEEDFAALLRGDEPPLPPVSIGATDAVGPDAAEIERRPITPCGGGAHFWEHNPPDAFAYCNCGEYTYRGFVDRAR